MFSWVRRAAQFPFLKRRTGLSPISVYRRDACATFVGARPMDRLKLVMAFARPLLALSRFDAVIRRVARLTLRLTAAQSIRYFPRDLAFARLTQVNQFAITNSVFSGEIHLRRHSGSDPWLLWIVKQWAVECRGASLFDLRYLHRVVEQANSSPDC